MARQRSEEVTIVGVASKDTVEAMADFVERHGLEHVDHIADLDGQIWQHNKVPAQPAWTFVDGETGESTTAFGPLGMDGLNQAIDDLAA